MIINATISLSIKTINFSMNNYRFADCLLDLTHQSLLINGESIGLELRNFLLLKILAEHAGEVVSREALHQQLWPKQVVSDWSLSRLVSDTRKIIGDDGKTQHIIKTCRGDGFMLVVPVIIDDTIVLPKKLWLSKRITWLLALLLIGSFIFWGIIYYNQQRVQSSTYKYMLAMAQQLDITKTAFIVQVGRRDELGKMLGILPSDKRIYWEKEFNRAYDAGLTSEQLFVFDQIRAITTGAIYQGNRQMLSLLQTQPALKEQIKSFVALERHLNFWLTKYQQVFLKRQDMCLLYVGVEDGVPFPSTVDQDVETWLLSNK